MGDPVGANGPKSVALRVKDLLRRVARLEKSAPGTNPRFTSLFALTGLRSPGVRTRTLTNSPVQLYVDADGNLGVSASTRAMKNIGSDYVVDADKFLAVVLKNWTYINNPSASGMGPIADDLDAAGLNEFVLYNVDGKIQGVRSDMLTIGLWSMVKQFRAQTLARVAKQQRQMVTVAVGNALALGGTRSFTIAWPTAFADAEYTATASVVNVTTGVVVAGASASVVQASKTATGCTAVVAAGIAISTGQALTVEAVHI